MSRFAILPLLSLLLPGAALAQSGGPDAFGYHYESVSLDFVPLAGSGAALVPLEDDTTRLVQLPWNFPFYGRLYDLLLVSANGAISFDSSTYVGTTNECLPTSTRVDIVPFWDDLNPSLAGAVWAADDTAAGRVIISWEGVPNYGSELPLSGEELSFQAHLYPDGRIEFHYADVDAGPTSSDATGGATATVGIQNGTGSRLLTAEALEIGCDSAALSSGDAYAFFGCDDGDGDFYFDVGCGGTDCDDADPAVHPRAVDTCGDGIDQDCSGTADLPDSDLDGYDSVGCGGTDCDDQDYQVHPGATDYPGDTLDQDCSGADAATCYTDSDGDGYGNGDVVEPSGDCVAAGLSWVGDDCDDGDAAVYPGAVESPDDGVDQDCDGYDTVTCFVDADVDGFGSQDIVLDDFGDCNVDGESAVSDDCDDADPAAYPGAPEDCDLIDSDCDSDLIDQYRDTDSDDTPDCVDDDDDGDGSLDGDDCLPTDSAAYPGAVEQCDGVDSDCDGSLADEFPDADADGVPDCIDQDSDGDTHPDATDCAPLNAAIYPGAPEACDGTDSNCDGDLVDSFLNTDGDDEPDCVDADDDGDLDPDATDCAPLDGTIHAAAVELCDLLDSDCDGDLVDQFDDLDTDGQPDCVDADDDGDGVVDGADCDPLDPALHPGAVEQCDLLDSDCDGDLVDQFDDLDHDGSPDCIDDDDDGDGYADADDCLPLNAFAYPGASESCDNLDSDCDGDLVDGFADANSNGVPDCIDVDLDGDGYDASTDCDDNDASTYPGAPEACDAVDSDCDGDLVDGAADSDADGTPDCADSDADGDGVLTPVDCDDLDPGVYPGATENCDDVDDDCDGDIVEAFDDLDHDGDPDCVDADDDGDGVADDTDCAPLDVSIYQGATEACDAVDSDCDGDFVDTFEDTDSDGNPDCTDEDDDGDGYGDTVDCEPTDPDSHPGAAEECDGVDNDCNGLVDDDCGVGDDDDSIGDDDDTTGDDDDTTGDDDDSTGDDDDDAVGDDDDDAAGDDDDDDDAVGDDDGRSGSGCAVIGVGSAPTGAWAALGLLPLLRRRR